MSRIITTISALMLVAGMSAQSGFVEEEMTFTNLLDSTPLNGTLTKPASENAKAVIVLATGSGLQDRDETIGRHKPFREIAQYLASNGYAVLRTDDRGYGDPMDTALIKRSTQWDELSDYRSLIRAMKDRNEFGNLKVGMLGHSLGGSEAIMSFSKQPKAIRYNTVGMAPEFIITLAAPAIDGDSLILDQVRQQLRLNGMEYAYDMYKSKLSHRYELAKSYLTTEGLRATLYDDVVGALPPGMPVTDELKAQIDMELDMFCSPAYREMLRYRPAADIPGVNVPWLALYGSKDTQVSSPLNPDALREAAKDKDNITVTVLEDKNHLFQNAVTGGIDEYERINGAISDDVLQEILEWLEMQFNNPN